MTTTDAGDAAFLEATTPEERASAIGYDWSRIRSIAWRIRLVGDGATVLVAATTGVMAALTRGPELPVMPFVIGLLGGLIPALGATIIASIVGRWSGIGAQVAATVAFWVLFVVIAAVSLDRVQGAEWAFVAGVVIGAVVDTATHSSLPMAFTRGGATMLRGLRANERIAPFVPVLGGSFAWFAVAHVSGLVSRVAVVGILDDDPGAIPVLLALVPLASLLEVLAVRGRRYGSAIAISAIIALVLVLVAVVGPGTP